MALVSILNVCQLSYSDATIESWIDDIMRKPEWRMVNGQLLRFVSRDQFVKNAMKLEVIQDNLQTN